MYLQLEDIKTILEERNTTDKFTALKDLPQPELLKDIQKASLRVIEAIKNDETINIVGDYDVDGIVSSAIMVDFFNFLGVEVNCIIPNRFIHGYGISPKILEDIYDGLIITVDNGISAIESARICKERGLDLIITDHHTVGQILPEAYAIVNPKQEDCNFPFKDICGAQVAWYLCAMLKKDLNIQYDLMKLFDILSIAIIADIMPMKSLNKTIVKKGLNALENSIRPSLIALKERLSLKNITEDDVGFKIAPLINCAGRMSDGNIALDFLLSFDTFEAQESLEYLIELNEQRKQEQLKIFEEAKATVNEKDEVIVVASENWNEGIIGIVASKLSEKYKKSAFVFSITNGIAKGSGRSNDVDLYALIDSCKDYLIGFGGHKGAAGLSISIDKLDDFKQALNVNVSQIKANNMIDNFFNNSFGKLKLCDVDAQLFDTIDLYRPFGHENEMPTFSFEDIEVLQVMKMGKNKEFTKLVVSDSIICLDVVIFIDFENVKVGEKISFIATISKNDFRGEVKYNLMFKELL